MKTLYKSILDDEDVLMNNAKESTKNWLIILKNLLITKASKETILNFLYSKQVEDAIKPAFKNRNKFYWVVEEYRTGYYCNLYGRTKNKKQSIPIQFEISDARLFIHMTYYNSSRDVLRYIDESNFWKLTELFKELGAKCFGYSSTTLYI